jgi:AcrR family transcriptional regulator
MTLRRKDVKSRGREGRGAKPDPLERRAPLSRGGVIRAAVALADRAGIEAASMRRLAESLGVEAMSLYHHFDDKEQILDGMVDAVFGEIPLPPPKAGWRSALRERAISMRAALRRHPWALGLMESRARPGAATLQHHDWVLGTLRAAGFPVAGAAHAYSVLDAYVYGFALQEASLPFPDDRNVGEMAEEFLRAFPADRFPHLAEVTRDHVTKPGYSYAAEFEVGLDLILDGLERFRGTGGK